MITIKQFGFALVANIAAFGAANAVVIDFDSSTGGPIAAGDNITEQYADLGVHFLAIEDGAAAVGVADDEDYGGGFDVTNNIWTNCVSIECFGGRADVLEITFDSGASDISLQLQSFGGMNVTFNLYDALDNLIETVVATGDNVFVAFLASDVFRIEGVQPGDGWAWGLDDLSFTLDASEVPLPAALPLFLAGLAGLGAARRKRKTTA